MLHRSANELLVSLAARETSSTELVDSAISRVESIDRRINAVVVKDFERAREAARKADEQRAAGADLPLLGLPLTVKEAFDVQGLPTTWGFPGKHAPALADAVVVQRLRASGAIVLGKTNVATMLGDWQTANPVYGVTNNPWDLERTPGGSSGGGAAAVAAGMTPLDFGSDLAGSLRIPAAFCGVFAHRPSHGIVSMRGFAPPMAPRMPISPPLDQATIGPIARSAADLKMALNIIAGSDTPESTAWKLNLPPPRHSELKGFRVLILDEHPLVATSEEISREIAGLVDRLRKQGCTVGHSLSEIPDLKDIARTFSALLMSMMGIDLPEDDYAGAAEHARSNTSRAEEQSLTMSHRDWAHLDRHRLGLAAKWADAFTRWDLLLCPAAPCTAFRHDGRPFDQRTLEVNGARMSYQKLPLWSTVPTPTGLPVTTAPIGTDYSGLPIGVQIIGPRFEDNTCLTFADLLERRLDYKFKAPPQS